ncbi:nucleolar protein 9 [Fopius arisanus]|uniref:C14orf21 protein n=1 Tax=Fopius arisanus TaxID=64838 RepID=A0A0C9RFG5_9HYME|nr:PREDICTED: nucleolar protein 9 [Fopius arisanus]
MSETGEIGGKSSLKGLKRKKKRSANQIAKKLARRRDPGRGSELDSESYQYMVQIMEVLRTDFSTMNDKPIFVNNVFEQTVDQEVDLAKNQVGSLVLDTLMGFADLQVIERFTNAFSSSLRPICSDKYASHVLERIIQTCADRGNRNFGDDSSKNNLTITEEEIPIYNNLSLKLCRYVINNIEEFIYDTYANHILRTSIRCLGGLIDREDNDKKKRTMKLGPRRKVTQEFTDLLIDSGNRLLRWPQFLELGKDELSSGLLQSYISTLKDVEPKLTSSIIKKIISECFNENTESLSNIFDTESSLRLLESCLASASTKMYGKIFKKLFSGRLKELSLMPGANFSVQRLMDYCPTKEQFEEIFDEISGHFLEILERQNTGVLASLGNACWRLQTKQGPFVIVVAKGLKCDEPQERQLLLAPLIARLVNYEQFDAAKRSNRNIQLHLHGSLILQAILQFNKPIKIVNSLLSLEGEELAMMFSDPKGSRILDVFMDSKFVGEKSRDKLAKQLQGYWVTLACGIHGSRCLDKIWQHSKDNQRIRIMEELAGAGEAMNSTKTGRIISAKFNVPLFGKNRKEWSETRGQEEKTRALFASIISSTK